MTDRVIIEEELYEQAQILLHKEKRSPESVKKYLQEKGIDSITASAMVDDIIVLDKKGKYSTAKRNIVIGLVILILGVSIAMLTPNRLPLLIVFGGIITFIVGIVGTVDAK